MSARIIIVNYNSGEWLPRALASVLDNSDVAIAVVDNASNDDSVALARRRIDNNARVDWILNQQNLGFAAANNQVLRDLTEDYAVLLNPDCEINKDTLPLILQAMSQNPSWAAASCRIFNEDGTLQSTCRRRFPTPVTALTRMLKLNKLPWLGRYVTDFDYGVSISPAEPNAEVPAISGAFMVMRKTAIATIGMLDEAYFMHCEDLDWCKRCELAGWKVGFVPAASIKHAKGISSKSRPVGVLWNLHRGMHRFFTRYYMSDANPILGATVVVGIYLSFAARAGLTLLKQATSVLMSIRNRWRS